MINITDFTIARTKQVTDYSPRKVELSGKIVANGDVDAELIEVIHRVDYLAGLPDTRTAPALQPAAKPRSSDDSSVPSTAVLPSPLSANGTSVGGQTTPQAKPQPVAQAKPQPVAQAKPQPVAQAKPQPASVPKIDMTFANASYDLDRWVTNGRRDVEKFVTQLGDRKDDPNKWTDEEKAIYLRHKEEYDDLPF